MVEIDHVTVLWVITGELDDAASGGDHRRAGVGDKIDAFMHRMLSADRIDAHAKARRIEMRLDRQHRRQQLLVHRVQEQLRIQRAQQVRSLLDVARHGSDALRQLRQRKVLRRDGARLRRTHAGCVRKAEILRQDVGQRR